MPEVLSLVNTVSSTSIPVEIANAVNSHTGSRVTVGGVMETSESELDPDIRSMDVPFVFFAGDSNFDVAAYKRIVRHLRRAEYDIVQTHHNFSGSVARLLGRLTGVPIVTTEHNDLSSYSWKQRLVNDLTYPLADLTIYNSESTLRSRNLWETWASRRSCVIHNGVDTHRIANAVGHQLPIELPDCTLITNVGVMTEQKNQHAIIETVKLLDERGELDNTKFVLVGSGPLEERLHSLTRKLGVDENVVFTGYLPKREHVYSVLHRSDVFLVPSNYEGFCVAAVEAMACGLPIIASDIRVLREVIGESGVFVDHSDPAAIATAIEALVTEDSAASGRADTLRSRALTEFSLERTARKYHEAYCDTINQ